MTHHEKIKCDVMIKISALQTGGKEREVMEYLRSKEFACTGALIGGVFQNTKELHVIKYEEVMETYDKDSWWAAVEKERNNTEKYYV